VSGGDTHLHEVVIVLEREVADSALRLGGTHHVDYAHVGSQSLQPHHITLCLDTAMSCEQRFERQGHFKRFQREREREKKKKKINDKKK
jgi:hypothetical protein